MRARRVRPRALAHAYARVRARGASDDELLASRSARVACVRSDMCVLVRVFKPHMRPRLARSFVRLPACLSARVHSRTLTHPSTDVRACMRSGNRAWGSRIANCLRARRN